MEATEAFVRLTALTVADVCRLVKVCQPDAIIRSRPGLNVRVGNHVAPLGGQKIVDDLINLLNAINRDPRDPYKAHLIYETLHPFTDGNGRSGRAIWKWQINQLGPRSRTVWDAEEQKAGHGFAGVPVDNVGVQYGPATTRAQSM